MKRTLFAALMLGLATAGFVGCGEKASEERETTVSGPGGSTTTSQSTEVKTKGENPPPAQAPGATTTPK